MFACDRDTERVRPRAFAARYDGAMREALAAPGFRALVLCSGRSCGAGATMPSFQMRKRRLWPQRWREAECDHVRAHPLNLTLLPEGQLVPRDRSGRVGLLSLEAPMPASLGLGSGRNLRDSDRCQGSPACSLVLEPEPDPFSQGGRG